MNRIQDWRPVIRQVFATIWLYAGFLVMWAVAAHIWDDRIPPFAWVWVWVPFQWVAWTCGAWFLLVAGAWGVQEATASVKATWAPVLARFSRHTAAQTAPAGVAVPTMVYPAQPAPQDAAHTTLAQLVYDYLQTRPLYSGRAEETLNEMKEAGLFVLAGVPEPIDAADLSRQLDDAGWPKLPDKRRPGYPGVATGFRHVDQIRHDPSVTWRPDP